MRAWYARGACAWEVYVCVWGDLGGGGGGDITIPRRIVMLKMLHFVL